MTKQKAEIVIETRGLSKSFGNVRAVRDVALAVRAGEIYGFLGRNGAGKTTTIRMILGLIRPSAGSVLLFGAPLQKNRTGILPRIGYLVESASAYPNLTVRENLEIQRKLTGSGKDAAERVIELMKLGPYADRRAGVLSLGNKQRLSLARALLHRPDLLVLDEPANGLDPAGIVEIRALLRHLADREGVTIFMSSHLLDEVEQHADRIGIVNDGVLVEELSSGELRERGRLSIEVDVDDLPGAESVLRGELGIREMARVNACTISITDRNVRPETVARSLVAAGIGVARLVPLEEDLERHFMRITGGNR
jgi:ABC-2 type transport system ATP-binding protein